MVIASTRDPLTRHPAITLQSLADSRFVLREKESGTRMSADRHFRAQRFKPDIRLEVGSNAAIKESVAGGLGLCVISKHALHGHQKENGVTILNVEGFPLASAWHLVYPKSVRLSPLAQAFKAHIMLESAR